MADGFLTGLWKGTFGTDSGDIEVPPAYQTNPYSFLADPAYSDVTADLYDITQGTGQTVTERAGALESAKAQRAAASLMASQRGMNPALAAKLAGDQQAQIRGDMAGRIATGAMLERERGRQTLLGALEANRQARIDQERIQAGATGQANQNALSASLAQSGIEQQNQANAMQFWGNLGSAGVAAATSGKGQPTSYGPSSGDIAYGGATPEGRSLPVENENLGIANKAMGGGKPQMGATPEPQQLERPASGGLMGAMVDFMNNSPEFQNQLQQPQGNRYEQMANQAMSMMNNQQTAPQQQPSNPMIANKSISSQGFNPSTSSPQYVAPPRVEPQMPAGATGQTPWKDPDAVRYQQLPMRYQDPRNNPGLQTFDTSNLPSRYKIDPMEIPYEVAQGNAQRDFYQGLIDMSKQGGWVNIDGENKWEPPAAGGKVPNPEWETLANQYQGPTRQEWVEKYYAQKMRNKPQEVRNA